MGPCEGEDNEGKSEDGFLHPPIMALSERLPSLEPAVADPARTLTGYMLLIVMFATWIATASERLE